jgi:hypothetical protein
MPGLACQITPRRTSWRWSIRLVGNHHDFILIDRVAPDCASVTASATMSHLIIMFSRTIPPFHTKRSHPAIRVDLAASDFHPLISGLQLVSGFYMQCDRSVFALLQWIELCIEFQCIVLHCVERKANQLVLRNLRNRGGTAITRDRDRFRLKHRLTRFCPAGRRAEKGSCQI